MEAELNLRLTGTRDMLLHNARLANPLDPYTRAIKQINNKRKKTDEDYAQIAQIETRGAMYETEDELLGLPLANVWRSFYNAAKAYKLGEDLKRGLLFEPITVPFVIDGSHQKCETYLENGAENRVFYTSVVVQRQRTMRARPLVPTGWQAEVKFTLLTDVIQPENLQPVYERAGKLIGLCDWRPTYGTFEVEEL